MRIRGRAKDFWQALPFLKPSRSRKAIEEQTGRKSSAHLELGRRGEEYAAAFLESEGYRIVGSNFKLPVGRNLRGAVIHAEIDFIAYDGPTLCFIEVKTRLSDWFAPPQVNVDLRKQRQILRAANVYRKISGLMNAPYRFDVVSLVLPSDDDAKTKRSFSLLKNYFGKEKLRKRRWYDPAAAYDS